MKVEQIYTGCLAQGAYFIESNGEVAIVDPLREVQPYIDRAKESGAKIKYVLETHFHADFVSGHIDLAKATGATIVFGPNAKPEYAVKVAEDGEALKLGSVTIKVLHTPGHTLESTTFLLRDENGNDYAIFTGDTLFLGDVGRPDLAVKTHLTKEDLAAHLYDSLQAKIMPLADDVIVYPGHGAGSACGKHMSNETVDTLGSQKETNYALQPMSKEKFVEVVTDGLLPPPQYFPKNVLMNKQGYESITNVLAQGTEPLSPEAFDTAANATGALILDTRDPNTFSQGFIPNAINIGLDGNFAPWVGALITDLKQPILLVLDDDSRAEEAVTRLSRVGYDNTIGFLKSGFGAWKAAGNEVDTVENISAEDLVGKHGSADIVDIRKVSEYVGGHVKGARNIPLDYINQHMTSFKKDASQYIHCAGGYRSMIASSILKARGYDNVVNVLGGFGAIKETAIPQATGELAA